MIDGWDSPFMDLNIKDFDTEREIEEKIERSIEEAIYHTIYILYANTSPPPIHITFEVDAALRETLDSRVRARYESARILSRYTSLDDAGRRICIARYELNPRELQNNRQEPSEETDASASAAELDELLGDFRIYKD